MKREQEEEGEGTRVRGSQLRLAALNLEAGTGARTVL